MKRSGQILLGIKQHLALEFPKPELVSWVQLYDCWEGKRGAVLEKGWERDGGPGRGAVLSGGALGVGGDRCIALSNGTGAGGCFGGRRGGALGVCHVPRTAVSTVVCRLEHKLDNHKQHSLVVIVIFRASQEKTARHISDAPAAFIHNDMSRYNPQHIF